jgi:hypothetical protein
VRLLESREEVAGCLPLCWFLLLELSGFAFLYSSIGEHSYRCAWYEAMCTQPATYRVLQEQSIKKWDLSNLARLSAHTYMGSHHTDYCSIAQKPFETRYDVLNILSAIYKAHPLRVSQFADDIKSVVLEPCTKIDNTRLASFVDVTLVQLLQELSCCGVDQRFTLDQGCHCICVADRSSQLRMERLVS